MEHQLRTKNVARKPFAVLYTSGVNRLPAAETGKIQHGRQAANDAVAEKPFIFCDDPQDENAGVSSKAVVEQKKATFYLSDEEDEKENTDDGSSDTLGPASNLMICEDVDENARFGVDERNSGKKKFTIDQGCNTDNNVDMESCTGNGKATSSMDENVSASGDWDMKSRSSFTSISMVSATATAGSRLSEKEARRDIIVSCPEYAKDIHLYLREMEKKFRPKAHYIRKQPEVNLEMRVVLVDWMMDVANEYELSQETFHLAVSYTDRFLSQMAVRKQHLQLLGITAMFVASKYEEIYPPELQQFVYITDDTYTMTQVLQMEQIILKTLEFNLSAPTIYIFLISYLKAVRAGQRCQYLAKYLSDLVLMEYSFLPYLPSLIAASCVFLACFITDGIRGAVDIMDISGHVISDIYPCAQHLLVVFNGAANRSQQAIREKYKDDKHCRVALLDAPESLPLLESL